MSNLCRDDFDSGPKHVFSIEDGLWLGNNKIKSHCNVYFHENNNINTNMTNIYHEYKLCFYVFTIIYLFEETPNL